MHLLVVAFIRFHYTKKASLAFVRQDILENGYFEEDIEAKVLEVLKDAYKEAMR